MRLKETYQAKSCNDHGHSPYNSSQRLKSWNKKKSFCEEM